MVSDMYSHFALINNKKRDKLVAKIPMTNYDCINFVHSVYMCQKHDL